MWFLALFSVVASMVLLGLSTFPGLLELMPDGLVVGLGGVFALFACGAVSWHLLGPARPGKPRRRGTALVIALAVLVTPVLLAMHVPRRGLFQIFRADFERLLPQAPLAGDRVIVPLNEDLHILWVDQWGTDRRGGTYFRTLVAGERGGTRGQSFGFAHLPNPVGSPFGDAGYELQPMGGDWYSFAAADR